MRRIILLKRCVLGMRFEWCGEVEGVGRGGARMWRWEVTDMVLEATMVIQRGLVCSCWCVGERVWCELVTGEE